MRLLKRHSVGLRQANCAKSFFDLLVARDRFVRPGFVNRLVGLPLYYAAQVLLALAVY